MSKALDYNFIESPYRSSISRAAGNSLENEGIELILKPEAKGSVPTESSNSPARAASQKASFSEKLLPLLGATPSNEVSAEKTTDKSKAEPPGMTELGTEMDDLVHDVRQARAAIDQYGTWQHQLTYLVPILGQVELVTDSIDALNRTHEWNLAETRIREILEKISTPFELNELEKAYAAATRGSSLHDDFELSKDLSPDTIKSYHDMVARVRVEEAARARHAKKMAATEKT
ncbi:MAG TPA: hypothetical protein V6D17_14635 [Candidatus Obscuribacterales bacterium]